MLKNLKAKALLDLISCCAFCKIRIIPSPSRGKKSGGVRVLGGGEETVAGSGGGGVGVGDGTVSV